MAVNAFGRGDVLAPLYRIQYNHFKKIYPVGRSLLHSRQIETTEESMTVPEKIREDLEGIYIGNLNTVDVFLPNQSKGFWDC